MIDRHSDLRWVRAALKRSRVVALLGPRQSGKTTLARQFVPAESLNYFDLKLDELRVVYPGSKRYPLAKNVEVVPLVELVNAK
jgi:predicted AAA+ superfamily ATPase